MSTLDSSLNVAVQGITTRLGTGTKGTKAFIKEMREFWLVPAGYIFDGTQDFTDDYVNSLVASGIINVFEAVSSVEEDKTENSYEDIGRGVSVLDNKGLYGYKIKFIKGMYDLTILDGFSGFGEFDFLAVDGEGKVMGTYAADGTSLKGFTLGVHQQELAEGLLAKNTSREVFKIQLLETSEVSNSAIKYADDSFNATNASAINQINLNLTTPANTDTQITVKATYAQDGSVFTGATFGQFIVKINGVTANPTAGGDSATPGTYVLTGITAISATDVVSVSLYDNANNTPGITVGGYAYKSSTVSKTAV